MSFKGRSVLLTCAMLAAASAATAQDATTTAATDDSITVQGTPPADLSGLTEGPEIKGFISARSGNEMQVTGEDGTPASVAISEGTEIRGSGGFLGLSSKELAAGSLLNGLPVTIQTVEWGGGLVASRIRFKNDDLGTATMIRSGTAQQFAQHGQAIEQNAAATEALRGRMGDIDKYNVKGTTNVYFDTGKWQISPQDQAQLCQAAQQAEAMDNALLLVVGYTDAVGDEEFNQTLSERRAGRVVNYLQQKCSWAPYRMLTPTGMAEADPLADNSTPSGRAQNRRVSVNILVSKAVEGS